ncbi:MAG: hypothetical protein M1834_002140 [Cirrosporium novae-zelandiae]|nr:MAG: hypothetical protein M1834_002140 [Cirrosporium novae-zelandiae]
MENQVESPDLSASNQSKVNDDLDPPILMPEEYLRSMGKSFKSTIFPQKNSQSDPGMLFRSLRAMLNSLIFTADSPSIAMSHRIAACHTLSGFLEECLKSPFLYIQQLGFSQDTGETIFSIYLDRFNDCPAKPMRQLLSTLAASISGNPDTKVARYLHGKVLETLLLLIFNKDSSSKIRPACQGLALFLRKRVLTVEDVIYAIRDLQLGVDVPTLKGPDQIELWETYVETFTLGALRRMAETDMGPAVGGMLSTFFGLLMQNGSPQQDFFHSATSFPLWVVPVKRVVKEQPNVMDNLQHHLFPDLLKLNRPSFIQFMGSLPLKNLILGKSLGGDDTEVSLLFCLLQVGRELGLIGAPGNVSSKIESDRLAIHDGVFGHYLGHATSRVRIAALSILISTTSITKPFSEAALSSLQQYLPQLHADIDAKFRNDVLSLSRKLVFRLRASTSYLVRLEQQQVKAAEPVDMTLRQIRFQISFCQWYVNFLTFELRSTASYQRHIVALKALMILLRSDVEKTPNQNQITAINGRLMWLPGIQIFRPVLVRMLFDLIVDPFDDVRLTATMLLDLAPEESLLGRSDASEQNSKDVQDVRLLTILQQAEGMMRRTGRADHSDGVARLYQILFTKCEFGKSNKWWQSRSAIVDHILVELERGVQVAKMNLRLAVSSAPIHGYLIALRYIVSQPDFYSLIEESENTYTSWRSIQDRIMKFSRDIWESSWGILCIESPEGHEEDEDDDLDIGVKDTLSFSWRAVKESRFASSFLVSLIRSDEDSSLLQAIVSNSSYGPNSENDGLGFEDFKSVGGLCFTQLAELRHRGAFSTVSSTFASCCQRCIKSDDKSVAGLPFSWYQDTLKAIDDQAAQLTRRSAGLPALITGILSASPLGKFFNNVLSDLIGISSIVVTSPTSNEGLRLPQVHALNCLKDIVVHTKLGPNTDTHSSQLLDLAIKSLGSSVWAIRNCGMMLFKALIDRMSYNEGSGPESSIVTPSPRLSFDKYAHISKALSSLFKQRTHESSDKNSVRGCKNMADEELMNELVFPALEIASRTKFSDDQVLAVKQKVLRDLDSNIWLIRTKASRTYAILTKEMDAVQAISEMLLFSQKTSNALHGRLICIKELIQRLSLSRIQEWEARTFGLLLDSTKLVLPRRSCINPDTEKQGRQTKYSPFTVAAFIDVVNMMLERNLLASEVSTLNDYLELLEKSGYIRAVQELFTSLDSRQRDSFNNITQSLVIGHEDQSSSHAATPSLRIAVISSLVFLSLLRDGEKDLLSIVDPLIEIDLDAACKVIDQLVGISSQRREFDLNLCNLFTRIILGHSPTDVQSSAINGLAFILDSHLVQPKDGVLLESWIQEKKSLLLERILSRDHSSPMLFDADLRLRGCLLALVWQSHADLGSISNLAGDITAWISLLRFAGDERSDFSTRFSAAISLKAFLLGIQKRKTTSKHHPILLQVYLTLYDVMNDDDEEIRDVGAAVASVVVVDDASEGTMPLNPLAASPQLLDFLTKNFSNSPDLMRAAITRLSGSSNAPNSPTNTKTDPLTLPSAPDLLQQAQQEDTSLFVEEKQNLFIDPVLEIAKWSNLLTHLSLPPSTSPPPTLLISPFKLYIHTGLHALKTTLASTPPSGPLGWTSKPETFVLGLRFLHAAGVGLCWAEKEKEKEGVEMGDGWVVGVREVLGGILEEGGRKGVHPAWLEIVGEVLEGRLAIGVAPPS